MFKTNLLNFETYQKSQIKHQKRYHMSTSSTRVHPCGISNFNVSSFVETMKILLSGITIGAAGIVTVKKIKTLLHGYLNQFIHKYYRFYHSYIQQICLFVQMTKFTETGISSFVLSSNYKPVQKYSFITWMASVGTLVISLVHNAFTHKLKSNSSISMHVHRMSGSIFLLSANYGLAAFLFNRKQKPSRLWWAITTISGNLLSFYSIPLLYLLPKTNPRLLRKFAYFLTMQFATVSSNVLFWLKYEFKILGDDYTGNDNYIVKYMYTSFLYSSIGVTVYSMILHILDLIDIGFELFHKKRGSSVLRTQKTRRLKLRENETFGDTSRLDVPSLKTESSVDRYNAVTNVFIRSAMKLFFQSTSHDLKHESRLTKSQYFIFGFYINGVFAQSQLLTILMIMFVYCKFDKMVTAGRANNDELYNLGLILPCCISSLYATGGFMHTLILHDRISYKTLYWYYALGMTAVIATSAAGITTMLIHADKISLFEGKT